MDSLLANFNPNDPHFQQKLQLLEDPLPTKVKPKRTSRKGLEDKLDDSPSDSGSIKPSRMARYTGTPSKPYVVMGDFDYNAALSKLGAIFQRLVVTSEGSIGFIRQFHEKDEVPTDIAPLPRLVEAKGLEVASGPGFSIIEVTPKWPSTGLVSTGSKARPVNPAGKAGESQTRTL